jgi:hypothetical protein
MDENIEEVEVKRYQWVRGEKLGNVEIFKEEKEEAGVAWIYFESGARIKSELLSEFLLEVSEADLANNPIHGNNSTNPLDTLNPLGNSSPVQTAQAAPKSPVRQLLEKQAKKNVEEINLLIEMPIPKRSIYEVIRDSYDDGEVDKELTSMLLENLSNEETKEQLKKAVINLIETYYEIQIKKEDNGTEE